MNWEGAEFFHCPNGLTKEIAMKIVAHLEEKK